MKTQVNIKTKNRNLIIATGNLIKLSDRFIFVKDYESKEILRYDRRVFYAEKPFNFNCITAGKNTHKRQDLKENEN